MTTSPTPLEFQESVRDAFGFLVREFGCREVDSRASRREGRDPFVLRFANTTTLVQVEGINWGFAAQVVVAEALADTAQLPPTPPLTAGISFKMSSLCRSGMPPR